jgi:hypothetical protein
MGISKIEVTFFELALRMGVIPTGGHILELGESNLIPADAAPDLLSILAPRISVARFEEATRRAAAAAASKSNYQKVFGPARALYYAIFDPASYTALDLDQGPRRFCFDLNGPINLQQQFDCVINNGTSEHIFDQARRDTIFGERQASILLSRNPQSAPCLEREPTPVSRLRFKACGITSPRYSSWPRWSGDTHFRNVLIWR